MPAKKNELVEYLVEMLFPLGDVYARSMFGGWGIYSGDVMFGLFADTFYLKVDDQNREEFEALELGPFVYEGKGKTIQMSYHEAPESIWDDEEEALRWGKLGLAAARRQATKKKKSKKKKKPKKKNP